MEKEAHELAGKAFNLQSPKQLLTILYEEQGLPILAKTPKGQPSTAEDVLQELALNYRLPAVLIEHRQLSKLISTYIDALPNKLTLKRIGCIPPIIKPLQQRGVYHPATRIYKIFLCVPKKAE